MMNLDMWRKLADGEHPYDGGPFGADHIKVFRDDAREMLAIVDAAAKLVALPGVSSMAVTTVLRGRFETLAAALRAARVSR